MQASSTAVTSALRLGPKDDIQAAKEKEERLRREWAYRYDEAQPGGRALSINDLDYQRLKAQFRHEQYTSELARISESRTRDLHEQEMRRLNQMAEHAPFDAEFGGNVADDGGVRINFGAPVVEEKTSKRRKILGLLGVKK